MNEEYDVIVLGTGLTVSVELPAAAEEPGTACRSGAGEDGGRGGPPAPFPGPRQTPACAAESLIVGSNLVAFSAVFGGPSLDGVRGARSRSLGLRPHREGPVGRDWSGSSPAVEGKTRKCTKPSQVGDLVNSHDEIKVGGKGVPLCCRKAQIGVFLSLHFYGFMASPEWKRKSTRQSGGG